MNCPENRYISLTSLRGWRAGGADGREGTGREKGRGRQAGKEGPESYNTVGPTKTCPQVYHSDLA